jgi:hypothetical protein
MTKEEIKHRDELGKASRIISELGYVPDETMCCDKPDICLPSKDERQIGIEVVAYSTHRYEKSEDALYKIFNEYIEERLDKRSAKRYEIGVMFSDLQVPVGINYKKVKKQIFDEIDNLMIPNQPPMNRQYIESVTAWENPGVEHSFITCDTVVVYEDLNEKILLDCISVKEQKLKGYKILEEKNTISEYYLVVFFPINEHAELRGYTLPETFKTNYDRVYLVDSFYMNKIK